MKEYLDFTRRLLAAGRLHDESFSFDVAAGDDMNEQPLKDRYDALYPRVMLRCDREMSFATWLVNGVFPILLYEQHERDLARMLWDDRLYGDAVYSKKDGWSSFFGRMARTRPNGVKFVPYMLNRLTTKMHRAMPHFFFDVEDPAWVFEQLYNNPNLLKSGRTALACVMAFSFKYDSINETLRMTMIMRSNQWSHLYGDVYGGRAALIAILRAARLDRGRVTIFSPSFTMDDPKSARALCQE